MNKIKNINAWSASLLGSLIWDKNIVLYTIFLYYIYYEEKNYETQYA